MMAGEFPSIEPYASGMLDVGDGHEVYWECSGNPAGKPALYLHGGPGSGSTPRARRWFDPHEYKAILFDQRGSGRSRPLASEPDPDLSANTTAHLIADIERLRELHDVSQWQTIAGLSWGTTLGLAYAEAYPARLKSMVLAAVTTTTRREITWITEDVGRIFPREWTRFVSAIPESLRGMRLLDAYAAMLFDPDPSVREHAAREWCAWEDTHVSLAPGYEPNPRYEDAEFRLRFARLVTHYWRNAAFLDEDQLWRDVPKLNGISGALIHGRYDVSAPLDTAWRLHQRWDSSRLYVIADSGHGGGDSFADTIVDALNGFAAL